MFALIGIVVVLGSIIGGYLMEHGHLMVLFQPAELVIIGGAALGSMLIANPIHILMGIAKGLPVILKGSPYSKAHLLETLKLLYDLFSHIRKVGMAGAEADAEKPDQSPVFSKYPKILKDHHAIAFLCDTLRTVTTGAVSHHEIDQILETDIETHHHAKAQPVAALQTIADSLPGLGIVAAVLGVVITMGAIGGPPEEVGHKVAAALVGTFLGILLCYGFIGPLASNLNKINEEEGQYYQVLRQGLVAFIKGSPPLIAVEFARRTIPGHVRPGYQEMEAACRGKAS